MVIPICSIRQISSKHFLTAKKIHEYKNSLEYLLTFHSRFLLCIIKIYNQARHMENIDSIPGKLFYIIYLMFQQKTIDARSKSLLKDLVISNHQSISIAYEEYVKYGTELTLKNDLLKILKKERENDKMEVLSGRSKNSRGRAITVTIPKERNIQKISKQIRDT